MKLKTTFVTMLAAMVLGVVAGFGRGSTSIEGVRAQSVTCGNDTTLSRTCPQSHQNCSVGQCSWTTTNLNLDVPTCDPQNYEVHVSVTGECDDDVYQYVAALYDGSGYIGGSSLASVTPGGPPTAVICVGNRIPTAVVLSWTGMPPAGYTKGPSELTLQVCCSDCES